MKFKTLIPVTITSKNNEKILIEALLSVRKQKGVKPIIIGNIFNYSKHYERIIKNLVDILLPIPTHIAEGRNLVLQKALEIPSEFIVMINADVELPQSWIRKALKIMKKYKRIGALGGFQYIPQNLISYVIAMLLRVPLAVRKCPSSLTKVKNVPCEAVVYRREALLKLLENYGYIFHPYLSAGEDPEMCYRLRKQGYETVLSCELKFLHKMKARLSSFFRQQILYGKGFIDWKLHKVRIVPEKIFYLFLPLNIFSILPLRYSFLSIFLYYYLFFVKILANLIGMFLRLFELSKSTKIKKSKNKI